MPTTKIRELKSKVRADVYKAAELMVDTGSVLFRWNDAEGAIYVVVIGQDKVLRYVNLTAVLQKLASDTEDPIRAEEAAALIFSEITGSQTDFNNYLSSNLSRDKAAGKRKSKDPAQETTADSRFPSRLVLMSKNGMPNTTSVWERLGISVRIVSGRKELVGNINKLNQIRNEGQSLHEELNQFSHQSRQIIRFLTHYAEPDGSDFSCKSDVLADLFHCLQGFDGFYCGQNKITIHKDPAEVTAVFCDGSSDKIKPAIVIDGRTVLLENHQIVVGHSGMWIGMKGEYWWVPAVMDIIWLRNFILSDKPLSYTQSIPVRVRDDQPVTVTGKCMPVYNFDYSDDTLAVSLYFEYEGQRYSISENLIEQAGGKNLLRDKGEEKRLEKALYETGFRIADMAGGRLFCMKDPEAVALFVDKLLPLLCEQNPGRVFFTKNAAVLAGMDIAPLKLTCRLVSESSGIFHLGYTLSGRSGSSSSVATWKQLQSDVKECRNYVISNSRIYRIPEELAGFVARMRGVAQQDKASHYTICLPKGAQLYWIDSAADIPSAIPKEWIDVKAGLAAGTESAASLAGSLNSGFTGVLREYQKNAVAWMFKMINDGFNVILADEMGLGKTVQALALLNLYFRTADSPLPCLVVCPTSLVENWESESERFVPGLNMQAVKGLNRAVKISGISGCQIVITSYSLIKRDIEFYENTEFGIVILDEAQHIKNPATVNARVCKALKCRHRIVLSGTPLENSPDDVWSIFDFLNPGMLGGSETFRIMYSHIENDKDRQDELARRIAPFILRRHKKEVEDLPEKTTQILYCKMTDSQQKTYDDILQMGRDQVRMFYNGKSTRFDILSSLLRLRQLCCDPSLLPQEICQGVTDSAKMELLKELVFEVMDSGHRTLVFSQFTSLLAVIRKWCDEEKIQYEYLDGSTKNRFEKVNNFNANKDIPLFLLSLKAGGTGLNLTGADTVIIYDPWWNPSVESQATDRTHRIGQEKPVTTIKLVMKDSIEEKILQLQARKQGMFNRIIENNSSFSRLTTEDLAYLLN